MKVLLNVTINELEDDINRQILVDENIKLKDLCEFIIISMNGNKIPIYTLEYGEKIYYPYEIIESKYEKSLVDLKLSNLKIKKENSFSIKYNFNNFYCFDIKIDDFINEDNNTYFEVLSGQGYGVMDDRMFIYLKSLLTIRRKDDKLHYLKSEREYLEKEFNLEETNNRVNDYIKRREDLLSSKQYVLNISLKGFNKEIKRKVLVNNDIIIEDFCKKVVLSMKGDLSHGFGIKIGKDYLEEYYEGLELFYLNLSEKQRLKIIYDWGDNWEFDVTLSKIIDGHNKNEFEVLSGKGYGIIDDCGGIWGLSKIFSGKDNSWGKHNIEDFNLEKCNNDVNKI